jgi:hypothetical protein
MRRQRDWTYYFVVACWVSLFLALANSEIHWSVAIPLAVILALIRTARHPWRYE